MNATMAVPNPPVLVVDDSDEDFETTVEALRLTGLPNRIVRATTGDECLEILRISATSGAEALHEHEVRTARDGVKPALVLLDLNLPGLDGREALAEIRADRRLRPLVVIILSTSSSPRDLSLCYREGANAYHIKPVRHDEHLQMLREVLDYWLTSAVLPPLEEGRT